MADQPVVALVVEFDDVELVVHGCRSRSLLSLWDGPRTCARPVP